MFCFRLSFTAIALLLATSYAQSEEVFNRIASFPVHHNQADKATKTSAEIISASEDGNVLVYSDSPSGAIGFIDIADPQKPQPLGLVKTDGEPTSVVFAGKNVLAAINTSKSFKDPSGELLTIDFEKKSIEAKCDLGGQPDSIAVNHDKTLLAIAIENERDEDLNDGALPQMPAGFLILGSIKNGVVDCSSLKRIDLTGLATIAPEDPEPEFVSFNSKNEVAVTLQENNHIVIVDGVSGKILSHFSAGSADLENVDMKKDGRLDYSQNATGILREPDAVKWLDDDRIIIANEGDYKGGSRGFTVFDKSGKLLFESGSSYEHILARAGHFPESRADKKGVEPEGLEVARFGDVNYIFVLAERGNAVGVYKDTGAEPEFVQVLPSGIAPESAVAIPSRKLLVTANEADLGEDGGPRSHVMIYELQQAKANYPTLVSKDKGKDIIGWGALSGLAASSEKPGLLYAVSDSFYNAAPTIYTIDATTKPATIIDAVIVNENNKPAAKLDLEAIALDGEGGFYLASEGNPEKEIDNALLHVNAKGEILEKVTLPKELVEHATRYGFEGIAVEGEGERRRIWLAIQRPWKDDPENMSKILAYSPSQKTWQVAHYPLEKVEKGWVGVSELAIQSGQLYILERDNQIGENAKIKRLYKTDIASLKTVPLGETPPVLSKKLSYDFLNDLAQLNHGYILDKIEGVAFDVDGNAFAITDNDGLKDASGETLFFSFKPN
ncbi:esterase-like activity of phytase family protein [Bartonella sp. HY761]|uniref:esterase-like activity of phytase family protein n=1 Tax=Bartonella sp. HY761 TaxID=2979330 RepID=UPI0021FE5C06|nr:esterase-like activity of phytase family protein [Bartonella sp. HY761]UXN05795.1 esterase-like activity of phytase family protein [Bartonella sp. HY761]